MFRDDPQSLIDISIRGMRAIVRGQVIEPYFHQPAPPDSNAHEPANDRRSES